METQLHALTLIMAPVAGAVVIWRFGKRTWSLKGFVYGAVIGVVIGILVNALVTPQCPVPTPWVQLWLPIALGAVGWALLASPWRLVFLVAMTAIALGLTVHFFSLMRQIDSTAPSASVIGLAKECSGSATRGNQWHSFFTGL
jgi:hypothetical protein